MGYAVSFLVIVAISFGWTITPANAVHLVGRIGRIRNVTIFSNGIASITRYLEFDRQRTFLPRTTSPKDHHRVMANDLTSSGVVDNSIIISPVVIGGAFGNGPKPFIELLDIKMTPQQKKSDETSRKDVTKKLQDLENVYYGLSLEKDRIVSSLSFIDRFSQKRISELALNVSDLFMVLDMQQKRGQQDKNSLIKIESLMAHTVKQMQRLKGSLGETSASTANDPLKLAVEFGFTTTGNIDSASLAFKIEYIVTGVVWKAAYDVHVVDTQSRTNGMPTEMGTCSVVLDYLSTIAQRTAEDWIDVSVRLSTAAPIDLSTLSQMLTAINVPRGVYYEGQQPKVEGTTHVPKKRRPAGEPLSPPSPMKIQNLKKRENKPVKQSHIRHVSRRAPGEPAFERALTVCDNSCPYSRDGVCDDPRGANYCHLGTDCQDCGPVGEGNATRLNDDDDYWKFHDASFLDQTAGLGSTRHRVKVVGATTMTASEHSAKTDLMHHNNILQSTATKIKASSVSNRMDRIGALFSNLSSTGILQPQISPGQQLSKLTSVYEFSIPYKVNISSQGSSTHRSNEFVEVSASSGTGAFPFLNGDSMISREVHAIKIDRIVFRQAQMFTYAPLTGIFPHSFSESMATLRLLSDWPSNLSTTLLASKDVQVFIEVRTGRFVSMGYEYSL
jgi:hypothetical protein